MASILGLGMTHYPMLLSPNAQMSMLLRGTLSDPDIPAEHKDPANWPELGRREWSDDFGLAAAADHRAALLEALRICRRELDEFEPDVVLVWGDDQYENFREEVVPPFCVLAYPDTQVEPFGVLRRFGAPNIWNLPDDTTYTMRGAQAVAKGVVSDVLAAGFDCAYSYQPRQGIHFPHSFANTQTFLDYENAGRKFPYPILPIAVNCYGELVIARRGGMAKFAEILRTEVVDPPGPSPLRCFELGRAIAQSIQNTDLRVAMIASSSWSHAFLNDKDWHIRPDMASDRRLYAALTEGDLDTWKSVTGKQIVEAGQHEMLNWFCLLGAMDALDMKLTWSDFVETEIFNSNKAFAVYH
ncbi:MULTISPECIES: DODA-type extradiol aromatic ring-opening family dioxygenase [Mycobacteriaceae]|uniref:Extradiol ring-cleavage dioxygenase class III protein subunit B n=1 Tax=Mycolicibacterium neoaurum VKM Ac-1815D TaxID=700508 RepID=V5XCJ3_MYCNE|nr:MULTISPECIES: extradiol ring-cleavage dioxygenase class III protein subunit B [Mycobacteriaceae]AHC26150.1 extradiol ring-cleavage dioxygenase [Mycolicibacterium neoaurum VKM Ac-1815D]AMO06536.1 extradiol ring-cleavage dioxygenase [Mycolicibacterium neoaurum]AXK75109.1 extradiol ring-cleavage dioxygenase [Mycolicibacterium neoaurum]KJQ51191.1 extradiol ring-cleavage dioxygenase [Mycolicibacterium neoaurum]KUM07892.1 extradiol ring-cleavage dioxygenase [Mycolicibacterium neoaurum]